MPLDWYRFPSMLCGCGRRKEVDKGRFVFVGFGKPRAAGSVTMPRHREAERRAICLPFGTTSPRRSIA